MKNFAGTIDMNYVRKEIQYNSIGQADKDSFHWSRMKSFELAAKRLKINPDLLPDVSMVPEQYRLSIIAFYKLSIIYRAVNDQWIPDYNRDGQKKWFATFKVGEDPKVLHNMGFPYVGSLCCGDKQRALFLVENFKKLHEDYWLSFH